MPLWVLQFFFLNSGKLAVNYLFMCLIYIMKYLITTMSTPQLFNHILTAGTKKKSSYMLGRFAQADHQRLSGFRHWIILSALVLEVAVKWLNVVCYTSLILFVCFCAGMVTESFPPPYTHILSVINLPNKTKQIKYKFDILHFLKILQ